ncbi:MAG: PHP domain-containing protein [Halanaerobiales bacterium]
MKFYNIDLHIHSVLSPCAHFLMTPGNIIKHSIKRNLDIIAITDHNSAENVETAIKMAEDTELKIIPGMEVETKEEVHLLCYFSKLESLLDWQSLIYKKMPDRKNDEEYFGYQIVTDLNDRYIDKVDRLLAGSVDITIDEVVKEVSKRSGYIVPAHIDRANGLLTNLGFVPPDLELPILEVLAETNTEKLKNQYKFLQDHVLIKNSDSHYLRDIKPMSGLKLLKPCLDEIFFKILQSSY